MPNSANRRSMFGKEIIALLALAIFIFSSTFSVKSQNIDADFNKLILVEKSGGVSTLKLTLFNKNFFPVTVSPSVEIDNPLKLINRVRDSYTIAQRDSVVIFLRIYVAKNSRGGTSHPVKAILIVDEKEKSSILRKDIELRVEELERVSVFLQNTNVYLYKNEKSARIEVNIRNDGNTIKKIHFRQNNFPNVTIKEINKVYEIGNGKDTIIFLEVSPISRPKNLADIPSYLVVADQNEKIVSSLNFVLKPVSSDKKFSENESSKMYKNRFEAFAYSISTPYEYYSVAGYGQFILKNDQLIDYKYRALYFDGNDKLFLRDTRIKYSDGDVQVVLGDQNEFLEKNLFGRGIRGQFTSRDNVITGLYLNNRYRSFSEGSLEIESVNSFMAKHQYTFDKYSTFTAGFIQQFDNRAKINSTLLNTAYEYKRKKNFTSKALLGGSAESHYTNDDSIVNLIGGAASFDLNARLQRVEFKSTNYYSSRNYSGSRRGELLFLEQMHIVTAENRLLVLGYRNRISDPKLYFNGRRIGDNKISSEVFEFLFSQTQSQETIDIRPYYQRDQILNFKSSAFRTSLDYKVSTSKKFFFSVSGDIGFVKPSQRLIRPYFSSLFTNYTTYGPLGLNILTTVGPYYIFEQFRYDLTNQYPVSLNFNPFIKFPLFNKKLNLYGGASYIYNSVFTNQRKSYNLVNIITLAPQTDLVIDAEYITLEGFQRLDVNIGIKKGIDKIKIRRPTLTLRFFEDENSNWKKDKNEKYKEDVMVSVNGAIFMTDSKGKLVYRRLERGYYSFYILEANGFFMPSGYTNEYFMSKDKDREVPLFKGGSVSGMIVVQKTKYAKTVLNDLAGYRITAIDTAGKEFYALTNGDGAFTLFLPVNSYTISLNKQALGDQFIVLRESQQVEIAESQRAIIEYVIKERRRTINIKKFDKSGEIIKGEEREEEKEEDK
ncbi:MAG: hypothetical protein ACJAZ3_001490 [Sphingobacteriales bacterium]|jgi:hypothetical protein